MLRLTTKEANKLDYKRIQILLIVIFVLFNGYLSSQLFKKYDNANQLNTQTSYTNIDDDLKDRNISLIEPLNNERVSLPVVKANRQDLLNKHISQLQNQTVTYDQATATLTSSFAQPIDLGVGLNNQSTGISRDQANVIRENFLKKPDLFIFGDQYTHWWYIPASRTLIFRMSAFDGKAIVDGTAEIRIQLDEQYKMINYVQTYQTDFYQLEEPIQLISSKEAVTFLDQRIETYLPNDSQIRHISLTYYRSMAVSQFNIYTPAWEIVYYRSDGVTKAMLVDAVRGQVIPRGPLENQ